MADTQDRAALREAVTHGGYHGATRVEQLCAALAREKLAWLDAPAFDKKALKALRVEIENVTFHSIRHKPRRPKLEPDEVLIAELLVVVRRHVRPAAPQEPVAWAVWMLDRDGNVPERPPIFYTKPIKDHPDLRIVPLYRRPAAPAVTEQQVREAFRKRDAEALKEVHPDEYADILVRLGLFTPDPEAAP